MLEIERFHDHVGCGESWQKGSPVDQLLWSYEKYLTLGEGYFSFRILSHVSGKVSAPLVTIRIAYSGIALFSRTGAGRNVGTI